MTIEVMSVLAFDAGNDYRISVNMKFRIPGFLQNNNNKIPIITYQQICFPAKERAHQAILLLFHDKTLH